MKTVVRILIGLVIAVPLATSAQVGPGPGGGPPSDTATITIRDGSTAITHTVNLPSASAPDVSVTPDTGTTSPISMPARSVLSVLRTLDSATADFDVTSVAFSDFGLPYAGGLYLNCISVPVVSGSPLCNNWLYTVNGTLASDGIGIHTLSNGNTVYVYFGSSNRVELSKTSVSTNESFTATAENYDPATDTFVAAPGVIIGVTQPNPSDSFNPTEIATSIADGSGQAIFTLSAAGSYDVGIKEQFYFPTTALTVTDTPAPVSSGGGGGGGGLTLHAPFDVPLALYFIASAQHADGSFDTLLLSDWAATAFAGGGAGDAQKKLSQYFTANPPALESVSDYERHALALEALGINPYSGTPTDYITPIVKAFDGTQVGDTSLVNDDIFAIFPLLHAGYAASDDLIAKTAVFIISKQRPDGSWEGSVDLSAAAIQALSLVRSLPGASEAITSGLNYIHAQEQGDGGFGNSFSTSWALQAIAAVTNSSLSWTQGYSTPQYYLATLQQTDGGVEPVATDAKTRVWATAYAVPGVTGKTWDSLLASFPKPAPASPTASTTTTIATTTADVATTTGTATDIALAAPHTPPPVAGVPENRAPESTSTPTTSVQVAAVASTGGGVNAWDYAGLLLLLLILAGVFGERWMRRKRERTH